MKKAKTKDFDDAFDRGDDVTKYLDKSKVRRVNEELRRVNIDFPAWVISSLDREARRLGVTRQSLVKMWIAEKFDQNNPVVD
ncbi:MAG: BrnA antitoxin family protein [Oligoflexia bacterium]|nr:BrnA antitoxin family protein [Oligoflexia bacterium]